MEFEEIWKKIFPLSTPNYWMNLGFMPYKLCGIFFFSGRASDITWFYPNSNFWLAFQNFSVYYDIYQFDFPQIPTICFFKYPFAILKSTIISLSVLPRLSLFLKKISCQFFQLFRCSHAFLYLADKLLERW